MYTDASAQTHPRRGGATATSKRNAARDNIGALCSTSLQVHVGEMMRSMEQTLMRWRNGCDDWLLWARSLKPKGRSEGWAIKQSVSCRVFKGAVHHPLSFFLFLFFFAVPPRNPNAPKKDPCYRFFYLPQTTHTNHTHTLLTHHSSPWFRLLTWVSPESYVSLLVGLWLLGEQSLLACFATREPVV
jgi:hypothetical protein